MTKQDGQNGGTQNLSQNGNPRPTSALATRGRGGLQRNQPSGQLSAPSGSGQLVHNEPFDQPVVLQQSNIWSRAILWGIVGFAAFGISWAAVARIEEAVPAQGKLQPQGQVQPVQAPVGGVVQEIFVEEGQTVQQGDLLIRFDPTATEAQRKSLQDQLASLQSQNQFYRSQLNGAAAPTSAQAQQLNLTPEILSLTANRAALQNEIQLYQAQLTGAVDPSTLTAEQRSRLQTGLSESQSREAAAQLKVSQLQEQLSQVQTQLSTAQQSLAIDQQVLADLRPLLEEGGIQRLQVTRQEQQVIESQSKVDELVLEEQRLQFAIAQAQQELQNTTSITSRDLQDKIAQNQQQIAAIDSQLNQRVLDNEARISEIQSQLSQTEQNLRYQELRAPVDGIVFDIQAKGPGFVANTSEPILKVVPNNALIAEVYVTNKDIGFILEGMPVDIRVDTYPFSEFGDIEGTVVSIGSDALPPDPADPTLNFYRFPVKVELSQQVLDASGKEFPIQSGMSISANIITRDRTIMSIITDTFSRQVDNLRTIR